MRSLDRTGAVYGRLTVLGRAKGHEGGRRPRWMCSCTCGVTKSISTDALRAGQLSCGCLTREATAVTNRTHGLSKSPEYRAWSHMLGRCRNPDDKSYKDYGGRGIIVCERWLNSFASFEEDMGVRPSPKHSLDRIDVNGPYSPENCRWATRIEQGRNRRDNLFIEFQGVSKTVAEWAEETGISAMTIRERIVKLKWSPERTLTQPTHPRIRVVKNPQPPKCLHFWEFKGRSLTINQWAKELGIGRSTLINRVIHRGMSIEEAFTTPVAPRKRAA